MTSEPEISRAMSLILDCISDSGGSITVENNRELHRVIGAPEGMSIGVVRRAMSRLIRQSRVYRPRREASEDPRNPDPGTVYRFARTN